MSLIAQKLSNLGITLVPPGAPAAAYVMAVTSGNQVFVSGHIAKRDGDAIDGEQRVGWLRLAGGRLRRGVGAAPAARGQGEQRSHGSKGESIAAHGDTGTCVHGWSWLAMKSLTGPVRKL